MLTPGVYEPKAVGPFGLKIGQNRAKNRFCHKHGWYNKFGEKIGHGDLTVDDLNTIADELPPDQAFITLCKDDSDTSGPDIEHVIAKAVIFITPGLVHWVDQRTQNFDGVLFHGIERTKIPSFIQALR